MIQLRRKLAIIIAAIATCLAGLAIVPGAVAPAHADSPYQGCVDENNDLIIKVTDAWWSLADLADGNSDPTAPWYIAKYFTYRNAFIDFELLNGSVADDWIVYFVADPNGVSGDTYATGTTPTRPDLTADGGGGPLALVSNGTSPNTKVYSGSLNAGWWGSADEAQNMWFPTSKSKVTVAEAISSTPKRLPIGIGIVRKADWPGTYNYLGQLSLPRNGPTSGSPNTPVSDGVIGVNDPSQCAFYYGTKLWNNDYTQADEPSSGGTNDECSESGVSGTRREVTHDWTQDPDITAGAYGDFHLLAHLSYTWCDIGSDDATSPATSDLSEDMIRLNSMYFCWSFDNGVPTGYEGFEGVDLTPVIDGATLDVSPATEVMDVTEDSCSWDNPIDLRNSIHTGNGDGGVWWDMTSDIWWYVDGHLRINLADDEDFSFLGPCDQCEEPPFTHVGAIIHPGSSDATVGSGY